MLMGVQGRPFGTRLCDTRAPLYSNVVSVTGGKATINEENMQLCYLVTIALDKYTYVIHSNGGLHDSFIRQINESCKILRARSPEMKHENVSLSLSLCIYIYICGSSYAHHKQATHIINDALYCSTQLGAHLILNPLSAGCCS